MATAFYEVRNVQRFAGHVRLEARFEASDGNGQPGSGTRLTFEALGLPTEGSDPEGWETVDINPFVSEDDLHRQLRDIAMVKDRMFRDARAVTQLSIRSEPHAVDIPEGPIKPTG